MVFFYWSSNNESVKKTGTVTRWANKNSNKTHENGWLFFSITNRVAMTDVATTIRRSGRPSYRRQQQEVSDSVCVCIPRPMRPLSFLMTFMAPFRDLGPLLVFPWSLHVINSVTIEEAGRLGLVRTAQRRRGWRRRRLGFSRTTDQVAHSHTQETGGVRLVSGPSGDATGTRPLGSTAALRMATRSLSSLKVFLSLWGCTAEGPAAANRLSTLEPSGSSWSSPSTPSISWGGSVEGLRTVCAPQRKRGGTRVKTQGQEGTKKKAQCAGWGSSRLSWWLNEPETKEKTPAEMRPPCGKIK